MKIAILSALLIFVVLLVTILYLLIQPSRSYQSAQPSLRSRQAAVGRAVLAAAQSDPVITAMVHAAIQAAPEEDRTLASDLITALSEQ
ncbi:hypothetical protein [Methylobacterium sp. E-045]|uniref:hypothetical protein n=1 Tax=Methylobacterium sp. E-045 TaxID=2836575 RepID=UPI001FBB9979|nr:hypothetical protein [Methylobacterium sp. E-045]MCJ2131333.1 hypothetical protein [Methylobacterium sp. E-045]